MNSSPLQIPKDPSKADLYFDPKAFTVGFRERPRKASPAPNALRIVVQFYGEIIEDKVFTPNSKIYANSNASNALAVPVKDLKKRQWLFRYTSDKKIELRLPLGVDGVFQTRDKIAKLEDFPSKKDDRTQLFELHTGSKGYIDLGPLQIYFEETQKPSNLKPIPFVEKFTNKELGRWLVLSVFLHILLMLLYYIVNGSSTEPQTLEELPEKYQKILIEPAEVRPLSPTLTKSLSQGTSQKQDAAKQVKRGEGREGAGAKAAGKEGKRGKSTAAKQVQRPDMQKIKNAGALSFFTKMQSESGGFDDLVDGSVEDVAKDLKRSGGGRFGMPDETKVKQGKGIQGIESGGGGQTASIGRGLATKGRGGGKKGDGLADFGTGDSKRSVTAKIDEDQVSVIGTLTQAQINDIIMKYWGQIQYCYEREIIRQPDLAGKVWVRFTIGLTGRVTQATIERTTLNSPPVETCVTSAFRRLPFPSPGGTIVEAVYPINFQVAG